MLAAAHALFGLQNFSSDGFVQRFVIHTLTTIGSTEQFCHGPFDLLRYQPQSHDVSVRFALCGINERVPFPAAATYLALIVATLLALAYGFFRAERHAPLAPDVERWRRTCELSAVVIVLRDVLLHALLLLDGVDRAADRADGSRLPGAERALVERMGRVVPAAIGVPVAVVAADEMAADGCLHLVSRHARVFAWGAAAVRSDSVRVCDAAVASRSALSSRAMIRTVPRWLDARRNGPDRRRRGRRTWRCRTKSIPMA